jgi:hypothetical protein
MISLSCVTHLSNVSKADLFYGRHDTQHNDKKFYIQHGIIPSVVMLNVVAPSGLIEDLPGLA